MQVSQATSSASDAQIEAGRAALDAHVRDIVNWHFDPATGCPFWLEFAAKLGWDPRREIRTFADLRRLGSFQDEWLRGGPVRRWVPRGLGDQPVYVFETGGTTGIPKTRVACTDFRTDYELFSATLPDEYFPRGSNWLMLGPSGPRRLRLSVEHLAQFRGGGICFCVDLDPRWVIKLIKKGWSEHLQAYKDHVIDQAVTILQAGHDIRCMFTTPKLLEALALRLESMGTTIRKIGHHGDLLGRHRVHAAVEPLRARGAARRRVHDTDLRQYADGTRRQRAVRSRTTATRSATTRPSRGPPSRSWISTTRTKSSSTAQTGRVKLTTLTKEFFVPGFLERDEGEREPPFEKYPWDGVSGVRPYRGFASTTTVGVY